MRHSVLLLLAAGLLACSEADPIQPPEEVPAPEPRPAKIEEMRIVKVRGDQAARVPPPEVAGLTIRAAVGQDGWTSEPLVARIEVVQLDGLQADDSVYVPKGTLVHWLLDDGAGKLFASTTATDDTATTVNRWAPGTKAGRFRARAGRLVGAGMIVYDAEFELEVLPGPPVRIYFNSLLYEHHRLNVGDTIDIREMVLGGRDAYGNDVPRDSILAWPDTAIGWAWSSRVCNPGCAPLPTEPTGWGWEVVVPSLDDGSRRADGVDYLWLTIWFPIDDPKRVAITVYDPEELSGEPEN